MLLHRLDNILSANQINIEMGKRIVNRIFVDHDHAIFFT